MHGIPTIYKPGQSALKACEIPQLAFILLPWINTEAFSDSSKHSVLLRSKVFERFLLKTQHFHQTSPHLLAITEIHVYPNKHYFCNKQNEFLDLFFYMECKQLGKCYLLCSLTSEALWVSQIISVDLIVFARYWKLILFNWIEFTADISRGQEVFVEDKHFHHTSPHLLAIIEIHIHPKEHYFNY